MWTKKYYSSDLRSAVLKVKDELGSNAVILSHQRSQNGFEVTATLGQFALQGESIPLALDQENEKTQSINDTSEQSAPPGNSKCQYFDVAKNDLVEIDNEANNAESESAGKYAGHNNDVNNTKQGDDVMPNKLGRMMQASDSAIRDALAKVLLQDQGAQESNVGGSGLTRREPPLLANRYRNEPNQNGSNNVLAEPQLPKDKSAEGNQSKLAGHKLIRQLLKLDISPVIARLVADTLVSDVPDYKTLLPQALALISNQIPIYKEDVTACGGIVALLGATGVGKTTTIAKMAARYALRHGKEQVALITTDNNRIAAAEQLRAYSNIMGLDFKVALDDIELLDALNEFSDKAFVLIDTAGLGPKDISSSRFYDLFAGGITQIKNFLVMSAAMHRSALEQSTKAFSSLKIDGSIITKVDETTSMGGPLSAAILNNMPVAFYSSGQQVPDDLHLARSHILMSRAVSVINQFEDLDQSQVISQENFGIAANVSL